MIIWEHHQQYNYPHLTYSKSICHIFPAGIVRTKYPSQKLGKPKQCKKTCTNSTSRAWNVDINFCFLDRSSWNPAGFKNAQLQEDCCKIRAYSTTQCNRKLSCTQLQRWRITVTSCSVGSLIVWREKSAFVKLYSTGQAFSRCQTKSSWIFRVSVNNA